MYKNISLDNCISKESGAVFVLAKLICPITSTLADVKCQGPHRISISDRQLLPLFYFSHVPVIKSSSYKKA